MGCESGAGNYDKQRGETAAEALREKMSHIMLRRTQEDILRHLLLPRIDYVVYCKMTDLQSQRYKQIADKIRRFFSLTFIFRYGF